jgi:hypothetical protein
MSELASGAATSTVSGTLDPAGVARLDFRANGDSTEYFSGRVDGDLRDGMLRLAFQSKTARACNYLFELRRAPPAQDASSTSTSGPR